MASKTRALLRLKADKVRAVGSRGSAERAPVASWSRGDGAGRPPSVPRGAQLPAFRTAAARRRRRVDLGLRDQQGRRQRDRVAEVAHDQSLLEQCRRTAEQPRPWGTGPGSSARRRSPRRQEAEPAHLADDRRALERPQPVDQAPPHPLGVLDEVLLLQDLDRLECGGAATGVRVVGEALPEGEFLRAGGQDLVDAVRRQRRQRAACTRSSTPSRSSACPGRRSSCRPRTTGRFARTRR